VSFSGLSLRTLSAELGCEPSAPPGLGPESSKREAGTQEATRLHFFGLGLKTPPCLPFSELSNFCRILQPPSPNPYHSFHFSRLTDKGNSTWRKTQAVFVPWGCGDVTRSCLGRSHGQRAESQPGASLWHVNLCCLA
jgi:hypothetical protein